MLKFCRSNLDDVQYGYALDNMLCERDLPMDIDNIPDTSTDDTNQPMYNEEEADAHFEQYLRTDMEDYQARHPEPLTQSQITQSTPPGNMDDRYPKRARVATNGYTPG